MKSLIFVVFGLFTFGVLASNIKDEDNNHQKWQQFISDYSKQVEKKLKANSIPGAALSIVHGEFGSIATGYGVISVKQRKAVDKHTRFRLASVSKTFAGSLAAKLSSEGRLDLNQYIKDYVPEFAETKYSAVKLHHVLSHSSGIVPNAYDNLVESRMNYDRIVERLVDVEPICQPGKCYGYQNVMFSVIDKAIEAQTGLPYQNWVEEFIFSPLQMRDGGVGYDNLVANNNYARPHVLGRKRWHEARLKSNYYKVLPAAGVNASAQDMTAWLKAQLGYYPHVLSLDALIMQSRPYTHTRRELKRRIWREHLEQAHYGLGWRIYEFNGVNMLYHSGWVQGYRTDVVVIPSKNIGFSLLLNAESGIINELTTSFILQALEWSEAPLDNDA